MKAVGCVLLGMVVALLAPSDWAFWQVLGTAGIAGAGMGFIIVGLER